MKSKYFNINQSGCSIRSKIYYNELKTTNKIIISCHGFAGHKDNKSTERFAEYILKKQNDFALISFDLPCHGSDVRKKIILDECGLYIRHVVQYAISEFKTDNIYAYATSFGGYLVLKYIFENHNPFIKIALRSPAVDMYHTLTEKIMNEKDMKLLSTGKQISVGFDRKLIINNQFLEDIHNSQLTDYDFKKYSEKILIIHGQKDELIPLESVEEFALNNNIKFIAIEGADHRFINSKNMDNAIKIFFEFFTV